MGFLVSVRFEGPELQSTGKILGLGKSATRTSIASKLASIKGMYVPDM